MTPDYEIKAYYRTCPAEGKNYGQLAMHTWHTSEYSRDLEASVFLARNDIAYIEVIDRRKVTMTRVFAR